MNIQSAEDPRPNRNAIHQKRPASSRTKTNVPELLKNTSGYLSFIALVVSLVAGSYGLIDLFYFRLEKDRTDAQNNTRALVRRITEINTMILTIGDKSIFVSQAANPEKMAILSSADSMVDKYLHDPKFLDPGSFFVLSLEHFNFGNSRMSLRYADAAIERSKDNRSVLAESTRLKARSLFAPGELQDKTLARQTFDRARSIVQNSPSLTSTQVEINILFDWLISEAMWGECNSARELHKSAEIIAVTSGSGEAFKSVSSSLRSGNHRIQSCLSIL